MQNISFFLFLSLPSANSPHFRCASDSKPKNSLQISIEENNGRKKISQKRKTIPNLQKKIFVRRYKRQVTQENLWPIYLGRELNGIFMWIGWIVYAIDIIAEGLEKEERDIYRSQTKPKIKNQQRWHSHRVALCSKTNCWL